MMTFRLAGFVLGVASVLSAQSVYVPAHFADAEGPSYASGGLGTTQTPSVLLSVLDELQGTPRMIRAVAVRREGTTFAQTYPAASLLVTVYASTAVTTASAPSATLMANHGADRKQLSAFSLVNLPASEFHGPASPFEFRIPFSTPFAFGGAGPLCLEIQVNSRTHNQAYQFDFVYGSSTSPPPVYVSLGTGCKATGLTTPMRLDPSGSGNWPGGAVTLSYYGYYMPANALVSVGLGTSSQMFGGVPLPFELPGSAGAPSGACNVYNDFFISIPALTNASGNMTLNLGLAVNPFYNGADLYGQAVALDAAANPFGIVTSNGVHHHLVAPYGQTPIGIVYSDNTVGPTGNVLANQGYVMKLDI